jgi:hypothetical protein
MGANPHLFLVFIVPARPLKSPRSYLRRICYANCGSLGVCCRCSCSPHRHLAGTCVGEDQSHDSADDGTFDRTGQPDRLDRPHRIVRSHWARRGGRVAKRARPLLFDSLPDAAMSPKPSAQHPWLLPKSWSIQGVRNSSLCFVCSVFFAAAAELSQRLRNAPAVRSRRTKYSVECEHRSDSSPASRWVTARGRARNLSL